MLGYRKLGERQRERVLQRVVAIGAIAIVIAFGSLLFVRWGLNRYEFVGLHPYRCEFASGSIPWHSMTEVGLDARVETDGVDAPSGALAAVRQGDSYLVAARLLRTSTNADLGIAVWRQTRYGGNTKAINALARKWSRVDAPVDDDGGTEAKVVARCLAGDKYP